MLCNVLFQGFIMVYLIEVLSKVLFILNSERVVLSFVYPLCKE